MALCFLFAFVFSSSKSVIGKNKTGLINIFFLFRRILHFVLFAALLPVHSFQKCTGAKDKGWV